jgi:hypothetical protein
MDFPTRPQLDEIIKQYRVNHGKYPDSIYWPLGDGMVFVRGSFSPNGEDQIIHESQVIRQG